MLLFRNAGPDTHAHLTPEQKAVLAGEWNAWVERLIKQGRLQHGHPLGLEGRVISGPSGDRIVDGPYAEAKEVVGGYICVAAANLDEAAAIGRQCPGLRQGLIVEVRPIVDVSPVLEDVRAIPRREN